MRRNVTILFFVFSLMASFATAQARRRAVSPEVPVVFQAAVDVVCQSDGSCRSVWHIFSPGLSTGDSIEVNIFKPDGVRDDKASHTSTIGVRGDGSPSVNVPLWQGLAWDGPFSDKWTSGTAEIQVVLRTKRGQYRVSADMPVRMPSTLTAGLLNAVVDFAGGVTLTGVFTTPPVVSAPYHLNVAIEVQALYGGWYIPPGAVGKGLTPIVVSSGIGRDAYNLKSNTVIVSIQ